jgi:hypothetical protein
VVIPIVDQSLLEVADIPSRMVGLSGVVSSHDSEAKGQVTIIEANVSRSRISRIPTQKDSRDEEVYS